MQRIRLIAAAAMTVTALVVPLTPTAAAEAHAPAPSSAAQSISVPRVASVLHARRIRNCVAGQWIKINEYGNWLWPVVHEYHLEPGVTAQWRMYSVGVPPYMAGTFTGRMRIWTMPSLHTSMWFLCDRTSQVRY